MGETSDTPRECPRCHADLDGGTIPEHMRHNYAPPYRWSKAIGISDGDSVHHWKCRYCGHVWPRHAAQRDKQEVEG